MPLVSIITPSIRCKGLEIVQKCLSEQTITDYEWLVEIGIPPKNDLSAALNRMLKRAKGKWVVMLQDYIKIEPNGLEQFLKVADEKKLITGAGGKTTDWEHIKWDWREVGEFRQIESRQWEGDWAIAPLQAFKEIGGYDEEYDKHWSFDNVELAHRLNKIGYTFWVLPTNKSIHYDHDKFTKHPFRERWSPDFHNNRMREIDMEIRKIKLNYL